MSASVDYQRLRGLFHEALGWPAAERDARLIEACADDQALLDEVRALFDAHVAAETFLEEPWARLVDDAPTEATPAAAGPGGADVLIQTQRLGRYALTRYLGQGGMGTVFLATRADDEYEEQVAIKVVRRDLVTRETVARFRRERQLLADLRDPNIAQLLDGGTTDDGRPYLVMEYVDGEPIDAYCDRHQLPVAARLRLFVQVCRAVHRAHQRLVVHRDLKPANLLVTADGRPKLLDFGVAKLLDASSDLGDAGLTRDRAPMTLDYASPEQIMGHAVTTASDVHALGVVLYELLAGRRPFQLGGLDPVALVDTVRNRRMRSVSTAAAAMDGRKAASRASVPERIGRRLEGDLDTIVAKALHEAPAHRYASAEDLAQELERHLDGMPVRARPDGARYKIAKFVGRHRWGVAASVLALLALLGFVGALIVQQRALVRQSVRATTTASFLADLFDLSNPDTFWDDPELREHFPEVQRGQDVNARQLLEMGTARIREQLAAEPEVQAPLLATMARAYQGLGFYDQAATLYAQALEVAAPGDEARLWGRLAEAERSRAAFDEAESALDRALALVADPTAPVMVDLHEVSARLAVDQGRFEEASRSADAGWRVAQARFGDDDVRTVDALRLRGDVAREWGKDLPAARRDLETVASRYRALYGERHPRVATIQHVLGLLHRQAGDLEAAEAAYRLSLDLHREIHGDGHPSIALSQHNLADVLRELGRADEAEPLARASVAMMREVHGDTHPRIGLGLNLLGLIATAKGHYETAEQYHRDALASWAPFNSGDHAWGASAHNNLAYALQRQAQYDEAESHYQEALAIYRRIFGGAHAQIARVLTNLGALSRIRGDLVAAEGAYRSALEIQESLLEDDHFDVLVTVNNLAVALLEDDRPGEAEPLARRVVEAYSRKLGPEHVASGSTRITLGRVLAAVGRDDEAVQTLTEAREILSAAQPPRDRLVAFVDRQLAQLGVDPPPAPVVTSADPDEP